MTYMDLKTFTLYGPSNICGFHKGQVEIDELIAPIISELNLKGYHTAFCCSGHPYHSVCESFIDSEEFIKDLDGIIKVERLNREGCPIRFLHTISNDDFYIYFDKITCDDFVVPLPNGFTWYDEDTIRYEYSETEPYAFFSERLKACIELYEWVKELPKNIDEGE